MEDTTTDETTPDPEKFADENGDALIDLNTGLVYHMADEHSTWDTGFAHRFIDYGAYHRKLTSDNPGIMKFRDARESDVFLQALAFTTSPWTLHSLTRNGEATWTDSAGSRSRRRDNAYVRVKQVSDEKWVVEHEGWIPSDSEYSSGPYWDTSVIQSFDSKIDAYEYAIGFMKLNDGYNTRNEVSPELAASDEVRKVLQMPFAELDDMSNLSELTRYEETYTDGVYTDVVELFSQPGDGMNLVRTLHKVTEGPTAGNSGAEIWYTAPEFNRKVICGDVKVVDE